MSMLPLNVVNLLMMLHDACYAAINLTCGRACPFVLAEAEATGFPARLTLCATACGARSPSMVIEHLFMVPTLIVVERAPSDVS
jgi:hypothetical protein